MANLNLKVNTSDISHLKLKIGDMLIESLTVDVLVLIKNAVKVTDIEQDGTVRIECIDPKCTKVDCTYLQLYDHEIKRLRINNRYKRSRRISVMVG